MCKIAVIGICGNSVFMEVDHFHQPGETLSAKSLFEEIGGKGINQAIAAARMGASVSFLAAIGDDAEGVACKKVAEENGICGCFPVKQGKRTPLAFILTDVQGENQVTVHKSAELTANDVFGFENSIAESDVLLLQQEVPTEVNECALKIAHKHGVKVILNPAPARAISAEMAKNIFLVTPNEQEAMELEEKYFKNCITTLGDKGCNINGVTHLQATRVQVVDTTGAGDTFNGVLAVCLAEGKSMEEACRYAITASGLSVTKPHVLDAIPRRTEIERKMYDE